MGSGRSVHSLNLKLNERSLKTSQNLSPGISGRRTWVWSSTNVKVAKYVWSLTCLQDTLYGNWAFTYRRQRGVGPREQSGIHKKHWAGIICKGILPLWPAVGEGTTRSPSLRELLKTDSQRHVVCIRELIVSLWRERGALLRKRLEKKRQPWRISIPRGDWCQMTQQPAYKTVSLFP